MYMIRRTVPAEWLWIVALMVTVRVATAVPVAFNNLLENPRKYHHQQVSVEGVARVQGSSFVLYRNLHDAEELADSSKAISIAQRVGGQTYDNLDNHWVIVTGLVDADRHGMWNYPCEILLRDVHLLPRTPGKQQTVVSALFRNETSMPVKITLVDQRGERYAEFSLSPNNFNGGAIRKGFAEVTAVTGGTIAKFNLDPGVVRSHYFDSAKRTYYLRVDSRGVQMVTPRRAETWLSKPKKEK